MARIEALDDLAHEVEVCIKKAGNFRDTAKARIATVAYAIDAGEYGDDWTAARWLAERCGVDDGGEIKRLLPPPARLLIAKADKENPGLSNVAIAKIVGCDEKTVRRLRHAEVETPRTGLDGRTRRLPAPKGDPELEEAVAWYKSASARKQDEFLKRVNARRL